MNQLNKLQIKAEILTILSQLQTNLEAANIDEMLKTLMIQEDKKSILEILIKELTKANEQKAILICFLLLKLCSETNLEETLWDTLKNPAVSDSIKAIILNVLKDMGNKIDYEKLGEYFENPNDVIDADTQKLLQTAIINPEAQIDFLDFVYSLPDADKKILVQSLGEDYSSDSLANILNPLALYAPNTEIGKIAIDTLGETKSQLALHTLNEIFDFTDNESTIAIVKRSISRLKISGIREDNAIEYYKNILSSAPYCSYSSYPDGHGNQAIIFSREREGETIQIVAIVINDIHGLIDCFGFNEISKSEFERIVNRFYTKDEHICIDASVAKTILLNAEKLTRDIGAKVSYEYLCWKTLLSDIETESVPIEIKLKNEFDAGPLTDSDLEKIYKLDLVQKWFFDTDYSPTFKELIIALNSRISKNDFEINLESFVNEYLDRIFDIKQKSLLNKRILMSAYLKFLSANIEDAYLLYSLYFDEDKKTALAENIIRKSIYEYYMMLRFKYKEENKMTNIFTMRNKQQISELSPKQVDLAITMIENAWVKE